MSNPFADLETAAHYEAWYQTVGRSADDREKSLLKWLLNHFPNAHSILEVGSGTGHFTRWLNGLGLRAVGLDQSGEMIRQAQGNNGQNYVLGDAVHLPFASKSFDLAALITTLEFLHDPARSLVETLRIARQGIILGVLNKQSRLGRGYKRAGGPVWSAAQFFTPGELRQMLLEITGVRGKIFWRTTLWPVWPGSLPLPWGGFIGLGMIEQLKVEESHGG